MARVFQVSELEARKQRLAAESDLYREMLQVEAQNLQLYGAGLRHKLAVFRATSPLLMLAGLVTGLSGLRLGGLFRRKPRGRWLRLGLAAMTGLRLYRNVAPLLQTLLAQRRAAGAGGAGPAEEKTPAANI